MEARALAQIEKSGAIDLKVVTKPWLKPLAVDVDLRAQNQNLADLTPFFKANAGVILEGTLVRGHGVVHVLGSRLRATVWAEYRDFSTRVHYAGDHQIDIMVNGQRMASGTFTLTT